MSRRTPPSLDSLGRLWKKLPWLLATLFLAVGLPAPAEAMSVSLAQLSAHGMRMLSVKLDDPREKEYRAIVSRQERLLGPEHPDTLASRIILADALDVNNKYAEAEQQCRAVLTIRERVLGPEHPDTVATREKLANELWMQFKCVEAEKEFRTVVAIRTRLLGAAHPDTLQSRGGLAVVMELQGRPAEAEQEWRAILRINERTLDPDDREIFASCYRLAFCLKSQHRLPEALAFFQRAETGWKKVLGPTHPETQLVQQMRYEIQEESAAKIRRQVKKFEVAMGIFLIFGVIAVSIISLSRRKTGSDTHPTLL